MPETPASPTPKDKFVPLQVTPSVNWSGEILRLLLKHAFWVLLCTLIVPLVVGFWTASQTKFYEASMTIMFDWSQPKTVGKSVDVYDPYSEYMNKQEAVATEFQVLTSARTARQVVLDAGLDRDREFIRSVFPGANPETITPDTIATWLRANVKAELVRGTAVARVQFEDRDPVRAQRLVAQVVDTYIRVSTEDLANSTGTALEWLTSQLSKLQSELEASETSLHTFKKDRNLVSVSFSDQNNMLRGQIQAFGEAVTAASIKRAQLMARANALAKVTKANPDDIPATELLADSVLANSRKDYLEARTQLQVMTSGISGKDENHPEVQIAKAKLDASLETFVAQVRNLQGASLREASVVGNELGSLQGLLESAKTKALDLNLQEIEYARLQRTTNSNEKMYLNILERMKEVDISRMINTRVIKVLDPPARPASPVRPKMSVNVGIGSLVGLVLGIVLAFLREQTNRTLKTPHDVESRLGQTSLGLLPAADSKGGSYGGYGRRRRGVRKPEVGPELMVHTDPGSPIAEAARAIRSNVLFMSPDHPPRTILVTSSSPGEGKTTSAVALAITFAQAGHKVALVDLDLRRPRVHTVFGMSRDVGVTNVLLGEPLEKSIFDTGIENLSVIPCGPTPPNPADLMLSEKMQNLVKDIAGRFDRVILDSAPVNPVTDTVILSRYVDGTVFVARAYDTTLDRAGMAIRSLLDVNAVILGVVLNAVDLTRAEYKYQYYRSYGGYRENEPSERKV